MTKLCAELELKFLSLEAKIESKAKQVNNIYKDEIKLLYKKFNITHLSEKYSNGLNIYRDALLKQISFHTVLEINQANEVLSSRDQNDELALFKKGRKIAFKPNKACIWKLVIKEFKFSQKFTTAQLIKYQQILEISEFVSKKSSHDSSDESLNNEIALLHACEKGHLEIVKCLVETGADVNAKVGLYNETALIIASKCGHFKMAKYLIENGAEVNARDKGNDTTLIKASFIGSIELLKCLLENGADVNAKGLWNRTPLFFSSENGYLEIVKFLVENGADVNAEDEYKQTPLILASLRGHFEIVKYLVEKGAHVNAKDKDNKTSLIFACLFDHHDIIKYLVENGADFISKEKDKAFKYASKN